MYNSFWFRRVPTQSVQVRMYMPPSDQKKGSLTVQHSDGPKMPLRGRGGAKVCGRSGPRERPPNGYNTRKALKCPGEGGVLRGILEGFAAVSDKERPPARGPARRGGGKRHASRNSENI